LYRAYISRIRNKQDAYSTGELTASALQLAPEGIRVAYHFTIASGRIRYGLHPGPKRSQLARRVQSVASPGGRNLSTPPRGDASRSRNRPWLIDIPWLDAEPVLAAPRLTSPCFVATTRCALAACCTGGRSLSCRALRFDSCRDGVEESSEMKLIGVPISLSQEQISLVAFLHTC